MNDMNKIMYALAYAKAVLLPCSRRERGLSGIDAASVIAVLNQALECDIWNLEMHETFSQIPLDINWKATND